MGKIKHISLIICINLWSVIIFGQPETETYLWEYPLQSELGVDEDLSAVLQEEIQKIIDSGSLGYRPITCRYSDVMHDHYFLYQEPGRLLHTVALAYPYLTVSQQDAIRIMVAELLANNVHAPWTAAPLSASAGLKREFYSPEEIWGLNSDFGLYRPTIQNVYSLWLYTYRTGDVTAVEPYYNTIKSFYNNKVSARVDPGNLYGTMCAHIGMARLAEMFDDQAQVAVAAGNLDNYLNLGLDMEAVDYMAYYGLSGWNAPYAKEYETRKDNWIYRGFIFLHLSPEIGRFMQDELLNEVMARHQGGMERFPLWWVRQPGYFTRWTGDEGVGIPSEMMGMVMPVERWVVNREPTVMRDYLLSAPLGVADAYWIEGVVYAIESAGTDNWVDVRLTPFSLDDGVMIWTGAVSGDWFDPANWDANRIPTINDRVQINSAPFKAVVPVTFTANARQIQFNEGGQLEVLGVLNVAE